MVIISYSEDFEKQLKKLDKTIKDKIKTQIKKIIANPEVGKTMKYNRKGTREVYIPPFRLSYLYDKNKDKVILLVLYHKDEQ